MLYHCLERTLACQDVLVMYQVKNSLDLHPKNIAVEVRAPENKLYQNSNNIVNLCYLSFFFNILSLKLKTQWQYIVVDRFHHEKRFTGTKNDEGKSKPALGRRITPRCPDFHIGENNLEWQRVTPAQAALQSKGTRSRQAVECNKPYWVREITKHCATYIVPMTRLHHTNNIIS